MTTKLPIETFTAHAVRLECGRLLPEVTMAYASRGRLAPDGRNAILVAHGYTSGPDTIAEGSNALDGSLAGLIGPGRPIDTDRFFVVCPNALGSSFGSTNAASLRPETGVPWGADFPPISVGDIVQTQKALLGHLGVKHLTAVVGVSFGGLQSFHWAATYPDFVGGIVAAVCAPKMPGVDVSALESDLSSWPGWNGGNYHGRADLAQALHQRRLGTLKAFGADAVLSREVPDAAARGSMLDRLARDWAMQFDAQSLLILFRAMAAFDASDRLTAIRAPILYVASRSDRLVPPVSTRAAVAAMQAAGNDLRYVELDSEDGHCAPGSEPQLWESELRQFLNRVGRAAAAL